MRELSQRLKRIGRPILPSGITKIEQGSRRVDVDDLVALAVALDVTPNRLLLTSGAAEPDSIDLTEAVPLTEREAWRWARGYAAVRMLYDDGMTAEDRPADERIPRPFVYDGHPHSASSRPDEPTASVDWDELKPHKDLVAALRKAVQELRGVGVATAQCVSIIKAMSLLAAPNDAGTDD